MNRITKLLFAKIKALLKRKSIVAFLLTLEPNPTVLDVGCGNQASLRCKRVLPNMRYIGLDIGNCNQTKQSVESMDEFVLVNPEIFSFEIEKYEGKLDAIISSHNLEHCNNPKDVLRAMAKSLKPGGKMFLSFPCEQSVNFPSRRGTLNFYDDKTHTNLIDFKETCLTLKELGLDIHVAVQRYQPLAFYFIGLIYEPFSRRLNRLAPFCSTWAFYGFESIIWAHRPR